MIISRGRRFIFVHAPKTGGTALSLALETRAMKDDILIGDTPKAKARRRRLKGVQTSGRLWKHSGLADIVGLVNEDEIASFFVVTLVRNPWDRVVSYYHWLRDQRFDHPAVTLAKSVEFDAFVRDPATLASLRAAPYPSYVTDRHGQERCDLFARIEHLDADLAAFEAHLGFKITPLARTNVSDRDSDYRRYFTDDTAGLIATALQADIARFGYGF